MRVKIDAELEELLLKLQNDGEIQQQQQSENFPTHH